MDQDSEALHEKASEHYLNGRFEEALNAWRELLRLNPEDERASEGLRLCGIMNDSEDLGSAKGSAEIDSNESPSPQTEEPVSQAQQPAPQAEEPAPQVLPPSMAGAAAAIDEVADLDFDLSALDSQDPVVEPVGLAPVEPDRPPGPSGFPPERPAESATAPAPPAPSAAVASDPVEDQLNRRVHDLLTEARTAADQGDRDEALSILSRIAILDEENDEARELEEALRSEISHSTQEIDHWLTEGVQWIEEDRLDEAIERFKRVLERSPDHMEARAYLEQAEQRLAGGEPAAAEEAAPVPTENLIAPLLDPPEQSSEALENAVAPPTVALAREAAEDKDTPLVDLPPMEPVPVPSGPSKRGLRPQAKLGAFVVLVFVAGAVGWMLFGGGGDSPVAGDADPGTVANAASSGSGDTGSGDAVHAAGASGGSASNIERAEGVAAAMLRASGARARGDIEDAILAYNEALSLDPDHAAARAGLFDAGEIFRERRAINDQLRKARIAFEDGEYTAALRLFYRLPENSVDEVTLTRYKVNGWINLGILGLKAGDTERAIEHLADAVELSNQHQHALGLLAFAEEHDGTSIARSYYVEVNEMQFLGLDD